ncbi:hypothetical protein RJT34_13269 [Clitoria ternatea]|uniref:Protein kinase domain-containing protein n=1 Tax=Clitoria ternatea TaxID=43366 RepID=A0AAN9JQA5_CLITE
MLTKVNALQANRAESLPSLSIRVASLLSKAVKGELAAYLLYPRVLARLVLRALLLPSPSPRSFYRPKQGRSTLTSLNDRENKKVAKSLLELGSTLGQGQAKVPRIYSITRGERGAHVVAGWPSWLTTVAGEAISGLARIPGIKFTEAQIKCYMQQLLRGLEHCHSCGVIHRDIKGSNLLLDNNGNLKIGDFGLATLYQPSQAQPLTSRVVTLWYRPPELLLGATNYGFTVDLWSVGCIFAELFVGKPIMPGRTEVEQLHKIFKLCGSPSEEYWEKSKLPRVTIFKPQQPYKRAISQTFKDFPSYAQSLLEVLLAIEPKDRGTASLALQHEFFTTKPLPCDPSILPKYPPSKEFDAKHREKEARRQIVVNKGHEHDSNKRNFKESTVVPILEAHALIKRQGQCNSKCIGQKYNQEDNNHDFHLELAKSKALSIFSHVGKSMHPYAYGPSHNMNLKVEDVLTYLDHALISKNHELRKQNSCWHGSSTELSRFSSSIAIQGDLLLDMSGHLSVNLQWQRNHFGIKYSHLVNGESNQLLDGLKFSQKKNFHPIRKDHTMGVGKA